MANNKTEKQSQSIKPVHEKGELTPEARQFVDRRFAESEVAFEPLVEKISQSRRITEEDLAFRVVRISS